MKADPGKWRYRGDRIIPDSWQVPDGRTYAFLGERSVQLKSLQDAPAGRVGYRVPLRTGHADEVGELPR